MNVIPHTVPVVRGITIELTTDDATHLSFALSLASKFIFCKNSCAKGYGVGEWGWFERLRTALDNARENR